MRVLEERADGLASALEIRWSRPAVADVPTSDPEPELHSRDADYRRRRDKSIIMDTRHIGGRFLERGELR